jgi:hypothetical protein
VRAEGFLARTDTLEGWAVRVISYRIGPKYLASVEAADAGAQIARASGDSRESAEREAIGRATSRLASTRRHA